mgnify:FL=1
MRDGDWDRVAGDPCPRCGQLDIRFINGLCRECALQEERKTVRKMELKARLKSLLPIFRARRSLVKRN